MNFLHFYVFFWIVISACGYLTKPFNNLTESQLESVFMFRLYPSRSCRGVGRGAWGRTSGSSQIWTSEIWPQSRTWRTDWTLGGGLRSNHSTGDWSGSVKGGIIEAAILLLYILAHVYSCLLMETYYSSYDVFYIMVWIRQVWILQNPQFLVKKSSG